MKTFALALALTAVLASEASADVGVMADVGAPDGATASLVYRPIGALRMHAGVAHNLISTGGRVGVTLVPLQTWFTPTLSVDYGRYPQGDARELAATVGGDGMASASLLEHVGYDYANGHLGLELGRERATFYLNIGVSRVSATLRGTTEMATSDENVTVTIGDSRMTAWSVSGRMGFIFYLP